MHRGLAFLIVGVLASCSTTASPTTSSALPATTAVESPTTTSIPAVSSFELAVGPDGITYDLEGSPPSGPSSFAITPDGTVVVADTMAAGRGEPRLIAHDPDGTDQVVPLGHLEVESVVDVVALGDLLVVLDAPQLDVESAAMLVEALPDGARLVLSGDPGVLGSAGPGRVFGDLLAARACPVVVSRTPDPGPVGELVSGVGAGELTAVDAPGHEVAIVPVRDPAEAVHRTVQLVTESVPRAFQVPPEQTLVVTPGHGGAAGTRVLNAALKEKCNPGPGRFAGFDPGDRVAYSPAPGRTELGQVLGAEQEGLRLRCAGGEVLVARDRVAATLRHGWAVTAHQAVTLRAPAAVVVVPGDAGPALARDWVYTAFGRAERHLSIVQGVGPALATAVAERPAKPRTTRLPLLLRPQLPAPATA